MSGAIVVAGGASTRMGTPKPFVPVDGEPLLRVVVSVLARRCRPVLVVATPGRPLPFLPAPQRVERLDEPPSRAGHGPLGGVLTGLERLADRGVELAYLSGCDAPLLSTAHVDDVLSRLRRSTMRAVVPVDDAEPSRIHGLCGAVRVRAALEASRRLALANRWSLRGLYEALGFEPILPHELVDPLAIRACNTPRELATLLNGRSIASSPRSPS